MPNRLPRNKNTDSDFREFKELQALLSNMSQQGQGDSTKPCNNKAVDKIGDLFKSMSRMAIYLL
jgi:hypothetical protein